MARYDLLSNELYNVPTCPVFAAPVTNIHKACRPDLVNAIFLKQISLVIAPFKIELFQMSLGSGDIPTEWKAV